MSKTKSVTLSVHRAIIRDEFSWTLAQLLSDISQKASPGDLQTDRGFFAKTSVKFPQFPKTNQAVAVQFALYEEGAKKSTIRPSGAGSAYTTSPVAPPEDAEFLEHEVAILVDGNWMIACGLAKREGVLIDTIGRLATSCGIPFPPGCMSFAVTPDKLTLDIIHQRGVKAVRLDAANLLGSLDVKPDGLLGHLFGRGAGIDDFKRANMVADLSIHPKGRKGVKLDYQQQHKDQWLDKAAVETLTNERVDSYTIILNDDSEWKEGNLKLSKSITVAKDGSSYSVPEALSEMLVYLEELKTRGHLK